MTATTATQQYALELMNQARLDPHGEFDRFIVDASTGTGVTGSITNAIRFFGIDLDVLKSQFEALQSTAPLSWNANLTAAAAGHNSAMIAADTQSHQLPGEPGLGDRARDAGYDFQRVAENIFAFADDAFDAHAGFFIDWGRGPNGIQDPAGHRINIMNPAHTEVGVAFDTDLDPATDVGPLITTQNFGNRFDYAPQIVGVVYDDTDGDGFYTPGEGTGGVSIVAAGGGTTTSAGPGGYEVVFGNGGDTGLTFSGGGLPLSVAVTVSLGNANAKVDLVDGNRILSSVDATLGAGASDLGLLGDQPIDGHGNDGANEIVGNGAGNRIVGKAGDDRLLGEDGADTLSGGGGDDTIMGGDDRSRDIARGGPGDDDISGGNGNDRLFGQKGDDMVSGGSGRDRAFGHSGNDLLEGGGARDRLVGGAGDDTLNGGRGNDSLTGGPGSDVFDFDGRFGNDTIIDFKNRTDLIDLSDARGVRDFSDLSISQSGSDTEIDTGFGTIVLEGINPSAIDASDFIF